MTKLLLPLLIALTLSLSAAAVDVALYYNYDQRGCTPEVRRDRNIGILCTNLPSGMCCRRDRVLFSGAFVFAWGSLHPATRIGVYSSQRNHYCAIPVHSPLAYHECAMLETPVIAGVRYHEGVADPSVHRRSLPEIDYPPVRRGVAGGADGKGASERCVEPDQVWYQPGDGSRYILDAKTHGEKFYSLMKSADAVKQVGEYVMASKPKKVPVLDSADSKAGAKAGAKTLSMPASKPAIAVKA